MSSVIIRVIGPAPSIESVLVTVPTHLVLHAGFVMMCAELPERPSNQQKQGVAFGAVVLDEEDHEAAMAELEERRK